MGVLSCPYGSLRPYFSRSKTYHNSQNRGSGRYLVVIFTKGLANHIYSAYSHDQTPYVMWSYQYKH